MLTRKYTRKPRNSISSQQKPISIALWLNQASCLVSSLQRSIISVLLWVSLRQWQGNHIGKFHTSHTSLSGFLLSWHQAPISFCNWRLPQPYLVARYPECTYSNRFGVLVCSIATYWVWTFMSSSSSFVRLSCSLAYGTLDNRVQWCLQT